MQVERSEYALTFSFITPFFCHQVTKAEQHRWIHHFLPEVSWRSCWVWAALLASLIDIGTWPRTCSISSYCHPIQGSATCSLPRKSLLPSRVVRRLFGMCKQGGCGSHGCCSPVVAGLVCPLSTTSAPWGPLPHCMWTSSHQPTTVVQVSTLDRWFANASMIATCHAMQP